MGSKVFEVIFIPDKAGDYALPSLLFNYFDPFLQAYKTVRTDELKVKVLPGAAPEELKTLALQKTEALKEEVKKESNDIYTVKSNLSLQGGIEREIRFRNIGALAVSGLALCFIFLFAARVRSKAYEKDKVLYRKKSAGRKAKRNCRKLSRHKGSSREFYVDAANVLNEYFADRFGVSPQGLTLSDIESQLTQSGDSVALISDIRRFYETADLARFTTHEIQLDQKSEMRVLIENIIQTLEKNK